MPKINSPIIDFSGKMDEIVFVNSRRYGPHTRKRPKPGNKKNYAALKQNYKRTGVLNKLASEINRVVNSHNQTHKHANFYFELHKRFRSQPSDNRFLLLNSLDGMNVHPRYTIEKLCGSNQLVARILKQKIIFELTVKTHPKEFKETNCYSFELLLITWSRASRSVSFQQQLSEWVYLDEAKPVFEFSFKTNPNTIHWILFLGQKMGWNAKPASLKAQGMQVVSVGTLIQKERSLLSKSPRPGSSLPPGQLKFEKSRVKRKRLD